MEDYSDGRASSLDDNDDDVVSGNVGGGVLDPTQRQQHQKEAKVEELYHPGKGCACTPPAGPMPAPLRV